MKKKNNIYLILTYLFFIYPPFIWGLVLIYQEGNYGEEHIVSLWINLILIAVIAAICVLLIYKNKIHKPKGNEIKHLIFGLIGNIVVYFYTFQNLMKIDDYISIYLILLIVLGVHYLLISRKIVAKELWLLMPIFLALDLIHLIGTGCGFTDGWQCYQSANTVFQYIIYSIMILVSLGYYAYRLYLLRQWDILKYITLALIIALSIVFQNEDWMEEKLSLTLMIALPFFTIVDFIITIVNKRYTHKMLFHYLRLYAIFVIFSFMGAFDFFYGEANFDMLALMVTIAYISLFIIIFRYLLKVDHTKSIVMEKGIMFGVCNEIHLKLIKEQFGEVKAEYVSLEINDYSLIAMKDKTVVGFISTKLNPLLEPLCEVNEAFVEILEVHPNYQKQGVASKLIEKTEKYFRSEGISQLRAWALNNNPNYINLWKKFDYCLSPTKIHIKEQNKYLDGYHFIKKL
ncbi:Acetyltransferase (GNAT) family protein [Candidatus Izimaplasma bacterium HR1]|jgi:GNAT superfamily N-acetyltransferase|uniref:GNAT family N-acetyltransferase n=1 Tax=Candidatus Izimoplasma sp. HR1 TaxID=1541959 RepID=UPI0004F8DF90|nr:Acetyltransferase (GNAT) family protein [Candidatus Izimaplasma bacterium HR1]